MIGSMRLPWWVGKIEVASPAIILIAAVPPSGRPSGSGETSTGFASLVSHPVIAFSLNHLPN